MYLSNKNVKEEQRKYSDESLKIVSDSCRKIKFRTLGILIVGLKNDLKLEKDSAIFISNKIRYWYYFIDTVSRFDSNKMA